MAIGGLVNLQDLAKQTNNKDLMAIAERLNKINMIIEDAHWEEANGLMSHKFTFRTKLPKGSWRLFNKGTGIESAGTGQGTAEMGMHENRVQADQRLCEIAPSPEKFYSNEVYAHSEGSGQFLAESIFYGNHTLNAAAFNGLAPQLNSLSLPFVYSMGGKGDKLTSIYGLDWGPNKVYMVKPKGVQVPIKVTNVRKDVLVSDETGKQYKAWVCEVEFTCGLVVEDPKAAFRICNLNPDSLKESEEGYFNEDILIKAINKSYNGGKQMKLYVNDDVLTQVEIRAKDKTSPIVVKDAFGGVSTPFFKNRPFRLCESILSTEEEVK